ncbi:PTS system mannose/fructose/sorbose family transporter subunit IID [Terribacillus aidingensis]|uniref:PTS system mannose/fructose/sorbose family transporter subunit IID n=1 Tax=Terribacillus aidingensis TaxID=586416 RepID=UPI00344E470A
MEEKQINHQMDAGQDELVDKKTLRRVFWRSFHLQGSFNYERMQALGYLYAMIPILLKLYPKKSDLAAALKRHLEFFNTTPAVSSFVMGISTAMEEKNAREKGVFDSSSINAIKVALMGPLAGIGDSFFWGTFRVIAAGIGISLASQGNILGAILFLVLYNIPHFFLRYKGTFWGYNQGTTLLSSLYEKGNMEKVSYCAGILGLIVIGAMTGTLVQFTTPLEISIQGAAVNLQDTLDQIMPNILPLGLTLLLFLLLKKGIKVNYIMIGIIAVGILGKWAGIL